MPACRYVYVQVTFPNEESALTVARLFVEQK